MIHIVYMQCCQDIYYYLINNVLFSESNLVVKDRLSIIKTALGLIP